MNEIWIMNWFWLFILLKILSIDCKPKGSKVIATFSEDDISDKLPSPESVAAQIPKKLILKDSSKNNSRISNSHQNKKLKDVQHSRRKKRFKGDPDVSFDRKSKSMIDVGDDGSYESDDETYDDASDNFIVIETVLGPAVTATITQTTGIQLPTASIVNTDQIQAARVYPTTKEEEQGFPSNPPNRVRRLNSKGIMSGVKRANSSSAGIQIESNYAVTLALMSVTMIIALF